MIGKATKRNTKTIWSQGVFSIFHCKNKKHYNISLLRREAKEHEAVGYICPLCKFALIIFTGRNEFSGRTRKAKSNG